MSAGIGSLFRVKTSHSTVIIQHPPFFEDRKWETMLSLFTPQQPFNNVVQIRNVGKGIIGVVPDLSRHQEGLNNSKILQMKPLDRNL